MPQTRIRVIAALVVRNERPYMGNCLRHLIENGIDYVIVDNGSTDGTMELLQQPYFAKHLIGYRTHPYQGSMDWESLMLARQAAADAVDTDWILYVSADEVMHSYNAGETLSAAIERADADGFDVIDFNEFVFLPIEMDYMPDREGPQLLRHYYFFEDERPRLMRARKKRLKVSHVEHAAMCCPASPSVYHRNRLPCAITCFVIKPTPSRSTPAAFTLPRSLRADGIGMDFSIRSPTLHSHLPTS